MELSMMVAQCWLHFLSFLYQSEITFSTIDLASILVDLFLIFDRWISVFAQQSSYVVF